MVGVILLSEKLKINPDNIATPIAASLGDVITLGVLAGFSLLFYNVYSTYPMAVWLLQVDVHVSKFMSSFFS